MFARRASALALRAARLSEPFIEPFYASALYEVTPGNNPPRGASLGAPRDKNTSEHAPHVKRPADQELRALLAMRI
jgi:hypothetical protein